MGSATKLRTGSQLRLRLIFRAMTSSSGCMTLKRRSGVFVALAPRLFKFLPASCHHHHRLPLPRPPAANPLYDEIDLGISFIAMDKSLDEVRRVFVLSLPATDGGDSDYRHHPPQGNPQVEPSSQLGQGSGAWDRKLRTGGACKGSSSVQRREDCASADLPAARRQDHCLEPSH